MWRAAILILLIGIGVSAQESQLGHVEFPTSGSPQAQPHFLRGLAALHSFWYEEAAEAFRESTKVDPDFMLGYWGEAMTYNHALWHEQDLTAARRVLAKIKDTPKLTERERAYLNAIKILFGDGEKRSRDAAYSAAMEKMYRAYPDDLDAAAFYSLSLLGLVKGPDKSFKLQGQAGAIALEVYKKNPNHPGAAHYIIHAYDDPEHAILALPAARRYASIAPEAHHARHMPSHIFLQLGMWPEAAASNEAAWESSDAWMKRKKLSLSVRDYHSLHWLLYAYLQQGRYQKAEELLALMKKVMSESTYDNKLRPGYYESNWANMAASFVVETERWNVAGDLFAESKTTSTASEQASAGGNHGGGHGGGGTAAPPRDAAATVRTSRSAEVLPRFVRGLAAAVNGSAEDFPSNGSRGADIAKLQVAALNASMKKDHKKAIELMKKAAGREEEMGAPSGPPTLIKPSHELFGEILLRAGKPKDAVEKFQVALKRQPNRARSLLGLARAAAQTGDTATARATYTKFLEQWNQADANLPELREARDYLKN